jgi:hypothetical protein
MADEIIKARVWQKVDTEENWLLNPLILGEGEQGFVWELGTPNNTTVNFKIGDGTKTFAELPYFIAYYSDVTSHRIIKLPNVSTSQDIPLIFNENTNLYDIVVTNIGGNDVVLKIGTTVGGSEIGEYNIGSGNTVIDLKYMFDSPQTLYLSGFDGNALSIIIIYFNYNENPAIPPGGGTPTAFRWPKGFTGMFTPVGTGHLEQCFDMITGKGVTGSAYENCQICNSTNTILNMEDSYPIGYKTGVTIGGAVGGNEVKISEQNIPEHRFFTAIAGFYGNPGFPPPLTINNSMREAYGKTGGGGKESYNLSGDSSAEPNVSRTSKYGRPASTLVALDNRPKSRYVIYFLAIED